MPLMDGLEATRRIRHYERTGSWSYYPADSFEQQHHSPELIHISSSSDAKLPTRIPIVAVSSHSFHPFSPTKIGNPTTNLLCFFVEQAAHIPFEISCVLHPTHAKSLSLFVISKPTVLNMEKDAFEHHWKTWV
jgi:CheY-like chemotaxis protein